MNKNDLIFNDMKIIDDKINNIDVKIDNYNKGDIDYYLKSTSFTALFNRPRPNGVGLNVRPQPPQVAVPGPQSVPYGSPVSYAGKIYEWDRGVIGVQIDGTVEKESLDGTDNHHADATVRIIRKFGGTIDDTLQPFQAGVTGTEQGILIFQSEGDKGLVYFPNNITEEQYRELENIITPRSGFTYSYTHNGEVIEDQTADQVLEFARSIISVPEIAMRA